MAAFGAFKFGMMSFLLPGILIFLMTLIPEVWTYQRGRVSQCVKIENEICKHYNYTSMPNILGHDDQEEASLRLREFRPLIENECSPQIKFFLCSLHFPLCSPLMMYPVPACRELCDEVRADCEPQMTVFGLDWPETITCERLPKSVNGGCFYPKTGERRQKEGDIQTDEKYSDAAEDDVTTTDDETIEQPARPGRRQKPDKKRKNKRDRSKTPPVEETRTKPKEDEIGVDSTAVKTEVSAGASETDHAVDEHVEPETSPVEGDDYQQIPRWRPASENKGSYPKETEPDKEIDYFPDYDPEFVPTDAGKKCKNPDKFTYVERLDRCLPICDVNIDVTFSSHDKVFAYYWMLACSLLCIISSSLTVGTFLVDSNRFRYPERPIIFLSLCYLLYSTAYLVRLGRGPQGSVSCVTNDNSDVKHIVVGDLESTGCTAVFFLLYYFGMAAAVWWVILSVTWFLAAGRKWGHEAIEAYGFYFHLVAWSLPAIQTIVVLVMGKVDGDELTGLCYVGNLDMDSLLYFVIVPLSTYLAIGALALGCGFLSLLKIRRVIIRKSGEKDAGKLEKLMLKIGIFTVLYIVPTTCVVAVSVYQYNHHSFWMEKAEARPCYPPGFTNDLNTPNDRSYRNAPVYPPYYGPIDYVYEYPYSPQQPYYAQGYDTPKYNTDTSYPRYGHDTGYPGDSGAYRPGYVTDTAQDSAQQGQYGPARRFYTGRELIAVPNHLSPRYPLTRRIYRFKSMNPLRFNPKESDALKAYGENMGTAKAELNEEDSVVEERDCHLAESIPSFPIFAIKIFMSLLAGITSGIWVWSGKTYKSWKMFCKSSWCGRHKEKENSGKTPQGTSIAPPSVTSQILPKINGRPSPDGELPTQNGNRYSYPALSSDRYHGYNIVKQDDDNDERDVTGYTSQVEYRGNTTGLTLGDIAREYSDNLDLTSREMTGNPRNKNYIVSQSMGDDVTDLHKSTFAKNHKSHSQNNKISSKKARNGVSRDTPTFISESNRAIPNIYEDAPSNRGRDLRHGRLTNRDLDGTYTKPLAPKYGTNPHNRVRKYSESDANKLCLVADSGFCPISESTRRKAVSVHAGTINAI